MWLQYAYILASGTITITEAGADDKAKRLDERNKGLMFKNFEPFTDFISKINNTQIDNTKDLDTMMMTMMMMMMNLIEYSDDYLETFGSLQRCSKWHYNKFWIIWIKIKITRKTPAAGNARDVKIAVPLKYLSNIWKNFWNAFN